MSCTLVGASMNLMTSTLGNRGLSRSLITLKPRYSVLCVLRINFLCLTLILIPQFSVKLFLETSGGLHSCLLYNYYGVFTCTYHIKPLK